jgi:hypothetical protein
VFKRLRILVLLYILLFVALGQFLAARRSTDWNDALWVDVYPVNASGDIEVQRYIEALDADAFVAVEAFVAEQAGRYGVALERPLRMRVASQLEPELPAVPPDGGVMSTIIWSLKMRWFVTRLHWASDAPTPDITVFAIYQTGELGASLDRSTALRKGLIAIANLYAARSARGSNQMIVAHELMHTLGASDKYDPTTGLPLYPAGFAEPERAPRLPQAKAELMGGRIPLSPKEAAIPDSLEAVVVGPATAFEIGWTNEAPRFP